MTRVYRNERFRVVIKLGTSTLTYSNGLLNLPHIKNLVHQVAQLRRSNIDVIIVSSGAIGAGMGKLGIEKRPSSLAEKQSLAAIGQSVLMHHYQSMFDAHSLNAGQLLLTYDDISDRRRFLNARHTINTMLKMGIIPIINENDVVAVDEIKVGDNDTLSALVSSLVDADLLLILSDIDGLYTDNPQSNPNAVLLSDIHSITEAIRDSAKGAGSQLGTGGMSTKIDAAQIATEAGCIMKIANNKTEHIITRIINGEKLGSTFHTTSKAKSLKQRWLTHSTHEKGSVIVDQGAKQALHERKSLLHCGIIAVEGQFEKGDLLVVKDNTGQAIAYGLSNYSAIILSRYKGKTTEALKAIYQHIDYVEAIHVDQLSMIKE